MNGTDWLTSSTSPPFERVEQTRENALTLQYQGIQLKSVHMIGCTLSRESLLNGGTSVQAGESDSRTYTRRKTSKTAVMSSRRSDIILFLAFAGVFYEQHAGKFRVQALLCAIYLMPLQNEALNAPSIDTLRTACDMSCRSLCRKLLYTRVNYLYTSLPTKSMKRPLFIHLAS